MDKLSVIFRRLVFLPVIDLDAEALNVTRDTLPVFREIVQFALHGTFARDLECSTRQKSSASAKRPFVKCQVHPVLEPKVRTNPKFKRCQVQVHWVHKEIRHVKNIEIKKSATFKFSILQNDP